ncbi:uncharacterized protein LOC119403183 [Rhipicephalus sanguineus]|uniref:uncharacterized protein LOC119403183 n=1 Tax=Rhipicephalus sanguineus TaxID=34632 RepID=UPI0020C3D131|nr:uncharacterized protein LOC119403183 [Rhipicephalus sanguineus]
MKDKTVASNDGTRGFSPNADREESGRRRSSFHWSHFPLTEMNTRDERIVCAFLVMTCAVVLTLFSVGMAFIFYAEPALSPLACLTPECIAARDYLSAIVNASRDVCSDFYGYVCDSWLERRKDGGSFRRDTIAAWVAKMNESLISNVGWEGRNAEEKGGIRVMRHVYGHCLRFFTNMSTGLSFEAALNSAREQLNWTQVRGARTYKEIVENVLRSAILSGCQTIMTVRTFIDNDHLAMRLSPGRSLLRKLTTTGDKEDLRKALERVLKDDLSTIVNADVTFDVDLGGNHFAEDQYEQDVAAALKDFLDDTFPNVTAEDWVHGLNNVLKPGYRPLSSGDTAFATGAQFLKKSLRNLADANGVAMTALYVASHLDTEILSLELSRERLLSDPEETTRFCVSLTERCLTDSGPLMVANLMDVKESVTVLQTMYQELAQALHDARNVLVWLSASMRRTSERKVDAVSPVVVSEDVMDDIVATADDAAKEDYAPLLAYIEEQQDAHFTDLYLKVMAYGHQRRARSPPAMAQMFVLGYERRHELAYSAALQAVVVPTLYQRSPFLYANGVPPQYNYATVGALLSARIAEIVSPASMTTTHARPASHHNDPGHGRMAEMYNTSVLCLQRLHSRLGLQRQEVGSGDLQRNAMYQQALSLRLAYEGLLGSLGAYASTQEFQTYWPEAQKTFFVRFCLMSCDAVQTPDPLSPRAGCLLPLHNMPEFAAAFGCASREDYVGDKCRL